MLVQMTPVMNHPLARASAVSHRMIVAMSPVGTVPCHGPHCTYSRRQTRPTVPAQQDVRPPEPAPSARQDSAGRLVKGRVFKRCYCTDPITRKELGKRCPALARSDHGSWWFVHDIPPGPDGKRRRTSFGPYGTKTEAEQALATSLTELNPGAGPAPDNRDLTFGHYLDWWIENRAGLKPTTRRGYAKHVRLYLKPGLGHLKLTELRDDHFDELYKAMRQIGRDLKGKRPSFLLQRLLEVRKDDPARRRPLSAATIARVHATGRKALNDAVRRPSMPIKANPSVHAERPKPRRRTALLWTAPRVAAWERTGRIPSPVMVWTPAQTGAFLDFAAADRLYPLWHLVAHRGPRRGETVGLGWPEVDLAAATAFIHDNEPGVDDQYDDFDDGENNETKSPASRRLIALDRNTVTVLTTWKLRQDLERAAHGEKWIDCGRVFTHPDGRELTPDGVSQRFDRLVNRFTTVRREHTELGWDIAYLARRHRMPETSIRAALDHGPLPPIRFHDLRHNAASLTYHATRDMKAVQNLLGHASIQITADIYTTLFEEADRDAAEAAARLVPRSNVPDGWGSIHTDPDPPTPETTPPEIDNPDLGL